MTSVLLSLATVAGALTVVTEYTYNADGALTALSQQINGGTVERTYLTWDNFVPDASDPSTGQVQQNNGRLAGLGSTPGTESADEVFAFDARDRLIGYSGPAGSETFDYHADGGMSVSSLGADELRFFYDKNANARVTNIHQSGRDAWSAYLGSIRFLDDGREQVLLKPRKDLACSYEAEGERLDAYRYHDAFGDSPLTAPPTGTYDLDDNPFRYTGEYRDPIWGGYYLRARWYDPRLTIFISRDDLSSLSRYGYTSGNPVMRVDPSGLKFNYMHDIGNPLGGFLAAINRGPGGHFARLLLAPVLGPLQIVADPPAFWHAIKTNQDGIDIFLAASIATQVVGGTFAAGSTIGIGKILLAQTIAEVALGTAQSAVAAAGRGSRHFDWNTFVQGLEYTVSGAAYGLGATAGIRALARPGITQVAEDLANVPDEASLTHSPSVSRGIRRNDSFSIEPDDSHRLGSYHDELVDATENETDVFKRINHEIETNGDDVLKINRKSRQSRKYSVKQAHKASSKAFRTNLKRSAIPVSRAPEFLDILEQDEPSHSFSSPNQAEIHAHGIIEELE